MRSIAIAARGGELMRSIGTLGTIVLALATGVGCSDTGLAPDAAAPEPDLVFVADAGGPPAADMTVVPDESATPDMTVVPDESATPDMTVVPDEAAAPDMVAPVDAATPDLAPITS